MGKFLFLFCVCNIFIYSYGLLFFIDLFYNFLVVGIVVILIVIISSICIVVIIENIFSELFIILVEKFFFDSFGFELKFFLEFFVENSLVVL